MRVLVKGALALGLAVLGNSASAGVVVNGGGSAAFQPVGAMSESGPAYWANGSSDGGQANVGYFLNKSGYFASNFNGTSPAISVGDMEYWGEASGAADADVTFTATGKVSVQLLLTLAGDYAVNEFGWYKAGDAGSKVKLFQNGYDAGDGTQSIVFGNDGGYGISPLAAAFDPGGEFGFYLKNGLGETFYTETSLNTAGSIQEFAILRSLAGPNGELYLGGEDRLNGDFDMNDYVIRFQSAAVPEPSSIALISVAGLVIGVAHARRRRKA